MGVFINWSGKNTKLFVLSSRYPPRTGTIAGLTANGNSM
jgi:hypothetical protein